VAKFAAGVVFTGGKFSAGVMLWRAVLVSLVVHLDLRISLGIFKKI
jgi:hypothetical protein